MTHAECIERSAELLGREHGVNAASWYFDGNTVEFVYEATLRGIVEGDPMVMDSLPSSPLSGEWADSFSLSDLAREVGVEQDDPAFDDVCSAYEEGFYSASTEAIRSACIDYLRGAGVSFDDGTVL